MWSLMMIKGFAVDPIDIALLQFLFHDCDLDALHPSFIAEWHPTVKAVCDAWKEAGPTGNINIPLITSHLATFVGVEVRNHSGNFLSRHSLHIRKAASLENRDTATHRDGHGSGSGYKIADPDPNP